MIRTLMKLTLLAATGMATAALAQHSQKEIAQDIERHKAMAAAHTAAAQCLASDRKPDACLAELQAACKGLALGKYCGMRHAH